MWFIRRWGLIVFAVAFATSLVFSESFPAWGHHEDESCGDVYKQEAGVSESANFSVLSKAAVRSDLRVIVPVPLRDEIIRSIYLFKTADDLVEFGYDHVAGGFPLTFSVKVYNGNYSQGYDGWPSNPNPGAGPLSQGSDHTFRIWRDPNGNDPDRVEMHRDGLYFGFYNHDRIMGAAVLAGAEGFSKCDDMQAHYWNMDLKKSPSANWIDWSAVRVAQDHGTKWWYNDTTQNPPEWRLRHCAVGFCGDA